MTSAGPAHATISFRKARPRDMDWAYQIFKTGMQSYITQTWGWDELFQEHSFFANLPASGFVIASIDAPAGSPAEAGQVDIGGYCLKPKADHLYLEMLLIDPAWQRRGYGSAIMAEVMREAHRRDMAVRLSVLKINPAYRFYQHLGFVIETEDDIRYRMISTA